MRTLSALLVLFLVCGSTRGADTPRSPNVLVVITDDQGYGDLGAHGNPVVRTPTLDAFAKQSVWLKNFYVCPVCSPTRSSLLTGLYNYRTGIVDTFIGRSLMRPDVETLPELLSAAGYRTGLFGKWHLGDNYPLRPEDRGFGETLWCQGGGLAQPSDPPGVDPKSAYFDPVLKRNGKEVKTTGYCTDVFTDAAVDFIKGGASKPFFAYVAYNAPHGPYQVPDEYAAPYRKLDLTAAGFPKVGQPWATPKLNTEEVARAYGMIENIDTNFARLLKALDEKTVADDTLVIFLTDNGPGGVRFNGGLRNRKGTVYEGGIRVPCYVRWPAAVKGGRTVEMPLAHIDVTPSVLAACGVKADGPFDGRSFLPLLAGNVDLPARTLFFQWHRGDVPEKGRAFAARGVQYKLVQAAGVQEGAKFKPKLELFDVQADPFEEKDIAAERPEVVAELKRQYEAWFADVTRKGFDPPRIVVGSEKENPVRLSRQDWRGPKAGWTADSVGHWEVTFDRPGKYDLVVTSPRGFRRYEYTVTAAAGAVLQQGRGETNAPTGPKTNVTSVSRTITVPKGPARVEAVIATDGAARGAEYVELKYVGPADSK